MDQKLIEDDSETWKEVTDNEAKERFDQYQYEHELKQGHEIEKKKKEWLLEKEEKEKTWKTKDVLQEKAKMYKERLNKILIYKKYIKQNII